MAFTAEGETFPSQEWYSASKQIEARGETVTTPKINQILSGNQPDSASLAGTLVTEKSLPEVPTDNLTAMKILMRSMTERFQKQGVRAGTQTVFGKLGEQGVTPSNISGSTVSDIVNFVEQRTTPSLDVAFANMADILDNFSSRQSNLTSDAQSTISKMVSAKMWSSLTADNKKQLWDAAGYPGNPVSPVTDTTDPKEIKLDIIDAVQGSLSQYKLNPVGFKEREIEMLTNVYGEEWADTIRQTVETLLPEVQPDIENLEIDEQILIKGLQNEIDSGKIKDNVYDTIINDPRTEHLAPYLTPSE